MTIPMDILIIITTFDKRKILTTREKDLTDHTLQKKSKFSSAVLQVRQTVAYIKATSSMGGKSERTRRKCILSYLLHARTLQHGDQDKRRH